MNTRVLMSCSAAFLAVGGIGLTFFPQETLARIDAPFDGSIVLLLQVLGAAFIGFATLNWMSRGAPMGGIYGRPVSMANLSHFVIGATALLKGAFAHDFALEVTALAVIYTIFAIWFARLLLTHPAMPSIAEGTGNT
jgi:hypothetical protein